MIKINLLGDTLAQASGKKQEKGEPVQVYAEAESGRSSFPIAGVLLGVLLPCLGAVYYVWLNGQVEQETRTKVTLEAKKKDLEKYITLEKTFRSQKDSLQKKKDVMLGLKTAQHLPVHLLEELANCLPDDVWFQEVDQKGMTISIKGESSSFEAVNQFRSRLIDQVKWFQNVNYPAANKKGRTIEFTISCDLKNSA
jgi:Tfp pilus assembly protein PilN